MAVGRRGINKTLNHGARREHVQSVPALRLLLDRAVLVFSEANRDAAEARNVPHVHTLLAALVLGEGAAAVAYRVRPIVKETNEGYRFYDHDLSLPPASRPARPGPQNAEPAGPGPGGTPSRRRGDPGPAGGLRHEV